jgi:CRISPR-associated protein Cas2
MLIISYDFSQDSIRTKFAKFLNEHGHRIQYSVFVLKNSPRILNIVLTEIKKNYLKHIDDTNSVMIFQVCKGCEGKIIRYGYAKQEEQDVIFL